MKCFHSIHCIPSPYRVHLFTEMWRQLTDRGVAFHCHFMSTGAWGNGRPKSWLFPKMDFPYTYWWECGRRWFYLNPTMIPIVGLKRPDWLLVGTPFTTMTGILASWFCGANASKCAWVEGNTKTPGVFTGFKGWLKRSTMCRYDYVAVPGSDGAKYMEYYGERNKYPIPVMLPNLIDETRFCPRDKWPREKIEMIRTKFLSSDSERLCIVPARLDPEKGLLELIELLTPDMVQGWKFLVLGQGVLKSAILLSLERRGLLRNFYIQDYVDYADMPMYYAAADLFLLPSLYDPNPLSVVEALHSGLPVAVSCMTGNVEEAVSEGENGWVLPVNNKELFFEVIKNVLSTPIDELRSKGVRSKLSNAEFWNTKTSVSRFLDTLDVHS